ncbi:hypothetical protein MASR2M15_00970 [Anaerolineales bacterium]
MTDVILTQKRGHIFEISLNRPDKRNAMNWELMQALGAAIDEAEKLFPTDVRAVVIKAEGRVFSSGIDLTEFMTMNSVYGDNWRDNLFPVTAAFQSVFNKIENCSIPVIAMLHGYVLGMAFEMALACDFRFAAERTRLALPEARLGIIPDVGGTTRLLKLVGPSRAKELIMTGGNIEADLAERWGILNYVVPKDELENRVNAFADDLALSAPLAVSYTKRTINDMLNNTRDLQIEAWAQAALMRTRDFENGVQAMLSKQYPVEWQGK